MTQKSWQISKCKSDEGLYYFKEVVVTGPVNFIFHRTWTIAFYVFLFLRLVWKVYNWIWGGYSAHSLVSFKPTLRLLHFTHKWSAFPKPSLWTDPITSRSFQWLYQNVGKCIFIRSKLFSSPFFIFSLDIYWKGWCNLLCQISDDAMNVGKIYINK